MKSAFGLLIDRCGLSIREAGEFLDVRLDTIKSWSSGRNPCPDGPIAELRALYRKIEIAASEGMKAINQSPDRAVVELGLCSDDYEARGLGWPCIGAQAAAFGLIAARIDRKVEIVARGSTISTAAAIVAHESEDLAENPPSRPPHNT